jgi:hypothetical protein
LSKYLDQKNPAAHFAAVSARMPTSGAKTQ